MVLVMVTCGDVYSIATRRIEQLRAAGKADTPAAVYLEKALAGCARVGPGKNCHILQVLARPGC